MTTDRLTKNLYFSDGSFLGGHGAWAVIRVGLIKGEVFEVEKICGITPCRSSIEAEAIGALEALRLMAQAGYGDLYCDNKSVIQAIMNPQAATFTPSQISTQEIWISKLSSQIAKVSRHGIKVTAKWLKSHQPLTPQTGKSSLCAICLWGNSQADMLANRTARSACIPGEVNEPFATHSAPCRLVTEPALAS